MNKRAVYQIGLCVIFVMLISGSVPGFANQSATLSEQSSTFMALNGSIFIGQEEDHVLFLPLASKDYFGQSTPRSFSKLTPADGATDQATTLVLDWEESSEAVDYEYCYDITDDDACSIWVSAAVTSQMTLNGLENDTTYYWQVRAINAAGMTYANGSATAYWSFTTAGDVDEPEGMILIPAGEFQMGCDPEHNGGFECSDDELPLHTVFLDAYHIDATEVTNAQYAQCVAARSCADPGSNSSHTRSSYFDNPIYANYPVIWVSWYNAQDYCTWAGKRLPTEAEWEKAARGLTVRAYPWGDGDPNCTLANSWNDSISTYCVGDTSEVGSYPLGASPYGVLDMAGDVYEWVNDWYQEDYYSISPNSNPTGSETGTDKVLRGGNWYSYWYVLRVANRIHYHPGDRYYDIGFRCASSSGN
jgi:formylglycine-generating enzyme required for sulfatase activity